MQAHEKNIFILLTESAGVEVPFVRAQKPQRGVQRPVHLPVLLLVRRKEKRRRVSQSIESAGGVITNVRSNMHVPQSAETLRGGRGAPPPVTGPRRYISGVAMKGKT
jgi:hypothetical protein